MTLLNTADALRVGSSTASRAYLGADEVWAAELFSQLTDDGVWTWFTNPRSVCYDGTHRKQYTGQVRTNGDVTVSSFDADTGAYVETVLRAAIEIDDHNNPAVWVRPDGRVVCFYSAHNSLSNVYYRISTNPEDVASFGAERTVAAGAGVSYSNPHYLTDGGGELFHFFRGANGLGGLGSPNCIRSTDADTSLTPTFGSPVEVIRNGTERPYVQYASNGVDRVDICCSAGHPRDIATGTGHIYHCYYSAGNLYSTDGTLIRSWASLTSTGPLALSEMTKLYDAATDKGAGVEKGNAWPTGVEYDGSGRPVVVFSVYDNLDDGNDYRIARWTGSAWVRLTLLAGVGWIHEGNGEAQYIGGIVCDPTDPLGRLYMSREISGQWEIVRWDTTDMFATHTEMAITRNSSVKNFRPFVPKFAIAGAAEVLFCRGEDGAAYGGYYSYTVYDTGICASPPLGINLLPANTVAPAVSGAAFTGEVLTCSTGTWLNSPSYAYQWKRNGSAIAGATANTYTLQVADELQAIVCTVTATNADGSASADSNTVTPDDAFHPTSIAGVRAWEAWEITGLANGDPVAQWNDLSTNANHFAQATSGNRPTWQTNQLNGLAAVRLDGSNDWLTTTLDIGNASPSELMVLVVVKATSAASKTVVSTRDGTAAGWILRLTATGSLFANIGATPNVTGTFTTTAFHALHVRRSALNVVLGVDGSAPSAVAVSAYAGASTRLDVGAEAQGVGAPPNANFFGGDIVAMYAAPDDLTSGEWAQIKSYVAFKTGLTIA